MLFREVFRLNDEPFDYFDDRRVHELLTAHPEMYLDYVRNELAKIADGTSQLEMPPKQIFHDQHSDGDFRVMPCVIHNNCTSRKTVKLIGTNIEQQLIPGQITVGKAFAIHPSENYITHVFEACLLSSARTGICGVLAIDTLATPEMHDLTIIGAGRVGYYVALYAATHSYIKKITFLDNDQPRAIHSAKILADRFPDKRFEHGQINGHCTTDILVLATTSKSPLCHPDNFTTRLIISLGADADDQHELDPAWVKYADIYVDTLDSVRYGDLRQWKIEKLISDDQLTDFISLLKNGVPPPEHETAVFISTGTALFDNITIGYLLSVGKKHNNNAG